MAQSAVGFAVVVLASAMLMSGCTVQERPPNPTDPDSIEGAYGDADERYYDSVGGSASDSKNINVPLGATKLQIKAVYSCGGIVTFELKDPAGATKKRDHWEGGKNVQDDRWFVVNNPTPGDWKLKIDVQGGCTYSFGVYIDP